MKNLLIVLALSLFILACTNNEDLGSLSQVNEVELIDEFIDEMHLFGVAILATDQQDVINTFNTPEANLGQGLSIEFPVEQLGLNSEFQEKLISKYERISYLFDENFRSAKVDQRYLDRINSGELLIPNFKTLNSHLKSDCNCGNIALEIIGTGTATTIACASCAAGGFPPACFGCVWGGRQLVNLYNELEECDCVDSNSHQ